MGFQLSVHPTGVTNFYDEQEVTGKYYSEIKSLIKRETGASEVIIFDHTIRSTDANSMYNLGQNVAASAVRIVHCDYTQVSAPRRFG
jgi:hypothetical protein